MTQNQTTFALWSFIFFAISSLVALVFSNATAFLWCAGIADVFGLALFINAITIKKRRRSE